MSAPGYACPVKCDLCERDATVREVTVRNGVRVERHLCERHAAEAGIKVTASQAAPGVPTPGGAGTQVRTSACPTCRTTFAEFKQHGLLGCAACYQFFEKQLAPLLERAHDGLCQHRGKAPARGGRPAPADSAFAEVEARSDQLKRLKSELERAVKAEQYERAAQVRDEIRRLCEGAEGPGEGSSGR